MPTLFHSLRKLVCFCGTSLYMEKGDERPIVCPVCHKNLVTHERQYVTPALAHQMADILRGTDRSWQVAARECCVNPNKLNATDVVEKLADQNLYMCKLCYSWDTGGQTNYGRGCVECYRRTGGGPLKEGQLSRAWELEHRDIGGT